MKDGVKIAAGHIIVIITVALPVLTGGGGQQQSPSYAPQPSYDYEAEHQRQLEAERQRQRELEEQRKREEEEAKKRQEEFERSKEEALKSMKGITENEIGLKGADTSGEFGLKGMGDTGKGDLGLKGIGDSSVVDLRDKKGPLVVDPNVVKGTTQGQSDKGQDARRREASEDIRLLFPDTHFSSDDVRDFLFPGDVKKGVFPKNPEAPLINPLREPERWKAYDEAARADLKARTNWGKAQAISKQMDQDPVFSKAMDRIIKKENIAIFKASDMGFTEAVKAFDKLAKKYGVKDAIEDKKKMQEDPKYRQQSQAIVDKYWKNVEKACTDARKRSRLKVQKEVDTFFERQAEKEKGEKQ